MIMKIWEIVELVLAGIFGLIPYYLLWKLISKLISRRNRKKKEEAERAEAEMPRNKIGFQQAVSVGNDNRESVKKFPVWTNALRKWMRVFPPSRLYHTFTLAGFTGMYFYDYCPERSDRTPRDERNHGLILDFKEGKDDLAIHLVTEFIFRYIPAKELEHWMLCVIPASTREKNEQRYRHFCERVSKVCGIQNGYHEIIILFDRVNSRERKTDNAVANLQFGAGFAGKRVLLFDDIVTRGASFVQCAEQIKSHGAASVTGLFLGKTLR